MSTTQIAGFTAPQVQGMTTDQIVAYILAS
jgi:hypothetical protein